MSVNLLPEEFCDFMRVSEQIQCYNYQSIGKHEHRTLEPCLEQQNILQKSIGMSIFDLPMEPEQRSNNYTGYNEQQLVQINDIVDKIYDVNQRYTSLRKQENEVHYSVIQIIGLTSDKNIYQRPLFKVFATDTSNDPVFLDEHQVYENFDQFLEENKFPGLICYPKNGKYTWDINHSKPDLDFLYVKQKTETTQGVIEYGIRMFGNIVKLLQAVFSKTWTAISQGVYNTCIKLYEIGKKAYGMLQDHFKDYSACYLVAGVGLTIIATYLFSGIAAGGSEISSAGVLSSFARLIIKQSTELVNSVDLAQFRAIFNYFCNANISSSKLFDLLQAGFWTSLNSMSRMPSILGQPVTNASTSVAVNDNDAFLRLLGQTVRSIIAVEIL